MQCKQWQSRQVGVKIVREMYGLLVHHQVADVKIVALGDYTSEARRFARGKPIELIHGGELIATVRSLQTAEERATGPMDVPLVFGGSMLASLLVIAGFSSSTASAPQPVVAAPVTVQAAVGPELPSMPRHSVSSASRTQPTIYASESQNGAEQFEWKRKNAESMKILEKTTKKMPLR